MPQRSDGTEDSDSLRVPLLQSGMGVGSNSVLKEEMGSFLKLPGAEVPPSAAAPRPQPLPAAGPYNPPPALAPTTAVGNEDKDPLTDKWYK